MWSSIADILFILVLLSPAPYVYVYLHWSSTPDRQSEYDVYYTLHGRTQPITEAIFNCTRCLTATGLEDVVIDAQCIGTDYKCAFRLGLQCVFKAFDYLNHRDIDLESIYDPSKSSSASDDSKKQSATPLIDKDDVFNDLDKTLLSWSRTAGKLSNIYGVFSEGAVALDAELRNDYDYLTGEWKLLPATHNEHGVWAKHDKYRRDLKLYLYDNNQSKRWIVGDTVDSDRGHLYASLHHFNIIPNKYILSPLGVPQHYWLYFNNTLKEWKKLKHFRFSPSSFTKPVLSSISIKNNSVLTWDVHRSKLVFTFSHFLSLNDYGELHIHKGSELYLLISGTDRHSLRVVEDKLILSNLTLPKNTTFSISIGSNLAYATPQTAGNGNDYYHKIISFTTTPAVTNWPSIASQYFSLALKIITYRNQSRREFGDGVEQLLEHQLIIAFFNALLFVDHEQSSQKNSVFNKHMKIMSHALAHKKQVIIDKNESFINHQQLQLMKANYYLQLSQINLLKAYHALMKNEGDNYKKFVDKALKICIKQYYGSKQGKKFADQLIADEHFNDYYCNFNTFDTYYYYATSVESEYDASVKVNQSVFINTIKLRWAVREYTFRFYDDLSMLFTSSAALPNGTETLAIDHLGNRIEFESYTPPRYDILFGLRNLKLIRTQFAKYGVVQAKNWLNHIECKWLRNYYEQKNSNPGINDELAFIYLQDFSEIMSYVVGHSVKKSYVQMIDFNSTNFYDTAIGQSLGEDSTYCVLLTINQDFELNMPFPIYIHKQVITPRKNQLHFITKYEQNYEILNNVGDAAIFKGTQHIHFAPYTKQMESQKYWALLFHFVDFDNFRNVE